MAECEKHTIGQRIQDKLGYEPNWPNANDAKCGAWTAVISGYVTQVDYCPFCGCKLPIEPLRLPA